MTIRFGTFNLFQFVEPPYSWYIKKDKFSISEWEKKIAWVKQQIQKMDCDVIGFQEVFSKDALEKLCKELGFEYFITVDTAKTAKENQNVYVSTTVALASKFPILKTNKVKHHIPSIKKHSYKGHFTFSRVPVKALIELPNKQHITVYVNHFKSNRLNEFEYIFDKKTTLEEKRIKTKEALEKDYSPSLKQRLIETSSLFYDFKKCKTPIICLCDLNDKEFSLCIDALTNRAYHENKKFNSYLLFDSFYLSSKKEDNPHPEKKKQRTPTSYYQSYGNVIDYIFVSKDFNKKDKNALGKVNSYEVLNEHLKDNKDGSIFQSDHAQVVCEINLFED